MRVYVESNFLLEIARQQEEAEAASELLKLARDRRLDLTVPAFSLAEPYWTLQKDSGKRKGYLGALSDEVTQLRRSPGRVHLAETGGQLIDQLRELDFEEERVLDQIVHELCGIAHVIELKANVILEAATITVFTNLRTQDAIILASIRDDLSVRHSTEESVFVSRDRKAFNNPNVKEWLAEKRCLYIPSFVGALGFVRASLARQ